jgi:hypothetical protein
MKDTVLKLTTVAATGAVTVKGEAVLGELHAILYVPGTLDTGAGIVVTCESFQGASKPLLTKTSLGTAALWFYPRDIVHAVADGSVLTGSAGGDRACPILAGNIQVVVSSGGATPLTGYVVVYYED